MVSQGNSQGKRGRSRTSPVRVSYRSLPYSEDDARDLLWQGYSPESVAKKSGFALSWVRAQATPRIALKVKLARRRGFAE